MNEIPNVPVKDRFAPIREGRFLGRWAESFGKPYIDDEKGSGIFGEYFEEAFSGLIGDWNRELMRIPREERSTEGMTALKSLVNSIQAYSIFHASGRNIFAIHPHLAEEFKHTDVNDVIFDDLALPYNNFYLSFGVQPELRLEGGFTVDGAYVERRKDGIKVRFSSYNPDIVYDERLNVTAHKFPEVEFDIPLKPGQNIAQGIDAMLGAEANERQARALRPVFDPIETEVDGRTITLVDSRHESAQTRDKAFDRGVETLKKALNLTVNSLCFISGYPDLTKREESVPQHLGANKKEPTNRKERRAQEHAERQLHRDGFSNIHFCRDEASEPAPGQPTGREMSAHWRRGHWRMQPFGTGFSQRRLTRIRPTLVRRDKGDPLKGHVYTVPPEIPSLADAKAVSAAVSSQGGAQVSR